MHEELNSIAKLFASQVLKFSVNFSLFLTPVKSFSIPHEVQGGENDRRDHIAN